MRVRSFLVLFTIISALLGFYQVSIAENIAKPNTFSSGTVIQSSQVNENFDTLYDQVNSLSSTIKRNSLVQEIISRVPAAGNVFTYEDAVFSGSPGMSAGKFYIFKSLIVSGTLSFYFNQYFEGNPTVILVDGNCTISGTLRVEPSGYAGGIAGSVGQNGKDNLSYAPFMSFGKGAGKGGDDTLNGSGPGTSASFIQFVNEPSGLDTLFNCLPGAGGGGGSEADKVHEEYGRGGNGGRGGGCLILIVLGNFDGTGGVISANGGNGAAGCCPSGSYGSGGGGGGGAGGTVVIAHAGSYSAPSFSVSPGNGGAGGGSGSYDEGGEGGSGGAGQSGIGSVAGNPNNGPNGGAGGAGSDGKVYTFQIAW